MGCCCALTPKLMRLPTGSSPGQSLRAIVSLTTTDAGESARSCDSSKARPRSICIPIVWKYRGLTTRVTTMFFSPGFGSGSPSIVTEVESP